MTLAAVMIAPLDRMRSRVLRTLGRPGRVLLADRSMRVGVYAAIGLFTAALMAFVAPVLAFALGPIFLGVPHLVSDVRYLVVRPGLHRRRALVVATGMPLLLATVFQSPALGLAAGFGPLLFSGGAPWRRGLLAFAWAAVVFYAARHASVATFAVLHGHNAVAVAIFAVAFARSRRNGIGVTVGATAMAVAILSGAADRLFASALTNPQVGTLLDMVAPPSLVADPIMAVRLAILFVFAQSFHYVLWLRVVPEEARERSGLRSFSSSLDALERDLGRFLLLAFVAFAVLVLAKACVSVDAARSLYLRGATFHAYLEIAFVLWLLTGEKR